MRDSFVFLLVLAGFEFQLEAAETDKLWPKGNVPVKFSPSFSKSERNLIREALEEIQNKTCVRFRFKTPEDADFVVFARPNDSTKCSSHIGRQGGEQVVYLGSACLQRRTILHQVMHTLGFIHEHCRPDRDDYVTIKWDNIPDQLKSEFVKSGQDALDNKILATGYAYDSIMHYTAYQGAKDKNIPVIVPLNNFVEMGGGNGLSHIDVERINLLYKCPE